MAFGAALLRARLEGSCLERDLGVQVNSELTFQEHIWGKVKTANKMVGLIRRNFGEAGAHSLMLIYKAMVRPHLEYAQAVWSPYKVKLVEALEKVQKRATKLIPGCGKLGYEERLKRLKLPLEPCLPSLERGYDYHFQNSEWTL